jgi:hypothetical protein
MSEPSSTFDVRKIGDGYEDLIPEQFADREGERLLIQRRVEAAQTGEIEYPLVEFYGVVGQGKSWLLAYLAHQYWFSNGQGSSWKKPPLSAKVDFTVFCSLSHSVSLLQTLVVQLKEQLNKIEPDRKLPGSLAESAPLPEQKQIDAAAKDLAEFITGLLDRFVPVLVFDATEKADEELLDWVEKQVVYPVIRSNRAFFIFGGRLWHRWKIFEVRRRVDSRELPPLDIKKDRTEGTSDLLTKLNVDRAEAVARALYHYAFGHPLATKVIFEKIKEIVGDVDEHTFEENQDAIAEVVEARVVKERFFDELSKHEYLQPLLWAVCILRKFNPTPLRHFTASFINGEYGLKLGGFYLDAIRDMQDSTLVQWNSAAGGYVLDPVVRKIMAKNLSMREPDEFRRRHQEAVRLYDGWIKQFPRNAVGFLVERTFHQSWALQGVGSQQEVEKIQVSEFDQLLREVEKHPDVQWDLPDMAVALNEELTKDEELREVISESVSRELQERAERFRGKFRGPWS